MQVHYDEGIANRIDPKPCAGIRKDAGGSHAQDFWSPSFACVSRHLARKRNRHSLRTHSCNVQRAERAMQRTLVSRAEPERTCAHDGGFVMWETAAINLYLAETYKNSRYPSTPQSRGRMLQWTFFATTEVEPALITLFRNRIFFPPDQRNEDLSRSGRTNPAREAGDP
ncbi:glutathione S-transferase family protein (plasmid) [Bradyrhizobium sp. CB82]|uniref:glutathione S-transferase family protein n=1 Tax=Bradyrhizobium sp. CB82 TaxID=3039159 RepID=UPI0024B06608|nr:glutathione S-transferase family protein [Bradyrhizobium sp. CB82]WFU46004.1 glutathione S-transferase family protein [Bradyrhizobium sp. CB82]